MPTTQTARRSLALDGRRLSLADFLRVARHGQAVRLERQAAQRMRQSAALVTQAVQGERAVYGVNTGFGALARISIPPGDLAELQVNLVRSHAAGVGPPLAEEEARGLVLLRANALAVGCSGVRPALAERLLALLNAGITPIIPAQGSVGASGDLAPLAHLAQVLIGEGEVWVGGRRRAAKSALKAAGLEPWVLRPKEGLALINGTQLMTAVGLLALADARAVLAAAEVAAAMSIEALHGSHAPFDRRLAAARPHPGQARVAKRLRNLLRRSAIHRSHRTCNRVQDPYSLRCLPQVLGASHDAFDHVEKTLTVEMNAATDNPLCFPGPENGRQAGAIVSGGNFHGNPVALVLDYLGMAAAEVGSIAERRIYILLDTSRSGLSPFLTPMPGIHSGLMVVQYTAAALVSENKVLCHPASVDSIPTCAGTEDHVSMGPIAARKARAIVKNVARVVACELITAAQALDAARPLTSGTGVEAAHARVRQLVEPLGADRSFASAIEQVAADILDGNYHQIEVTPVSPGEHS